LWYPGTVPFLLDFSVKNTPLRYRRSHSPHTMCPFPRSYLLGLNPFLPPPSSFFFRYFLSLFVGPANFQSWFASVLFFWSPCAGSFPGFKPSLVGEGFFRYFYLTFAPFQIPLSLDSAQCIFTVLLTLSSFFEDGNSPPGTCFSSQQIIPLNVRWPHSRDSIPYFHLSFFLPSSDLFARCTRRAPC